MIETPRDAGFRMPGEFEPHARTWMSWPCSTEVYAGHLPDAQAAHARVARAIARFEPVVMLAPPEVASGARDSLGTDNIEILEVPLNDSWLRDNGPSFLTGPDGLAAVDWGFNAWGWLNEDYGDDAKAARRVIAEAGARRYAGPLILEGGGIHVDGEGTLITTEQCLLNRNRNPHLDKADIETFLGEYLGIDTVIWLTEGVENDCTDGHVDGICCFAAPGVVLAGSGDLTNPDARRRTERNLEILKSSTDARGRPLKVIEVPENAEPATYPPGLQSSGHMSLTYINFYICNGAVIVPQYGDPNDTLAAEIIAAAFPDRETVQVDSRTVAFGGGNIHCITQQEPAL